MWQCHSRYSGQLVIIGIMETVRPDLRGLEGGKARGG